MKNYTEGVWKTSWKFREKKRILSLGAPRRERQHLSKPFIYLFIYFCAGTSVHLWQEITILRTTGSCSFFLYEEILQLFFFF